MRIRTISALSLVGLTSLAAPVFAGPVGIQRNANPVQQSAALDQLEATRQNLPSSQTMANARGPLMIRYLDKRAQLDDLIRRLKSDQQVAPEEIDEALAPVAR